MLNVEGFFFFGTWVGYLFIYLIIMFYVDSICYLCNENFIPKPAFEQRPSY